MEVKAVKEKGMMITFQNTAWGPENKSSDFNEGNWIIPEK